MIIIDGIKVVRSSNDINKNHYKNMCREFEIKQWLPVSHDLLRNKEYLIDNRSRTTFYQLLCSRIVRAPMKHDDLGIYKNYYKKYFLACNISVETLAGLFGYKGNNVITKWIKELIERKYIIVDKMKLEGQRERSVYILGVHNNVKEYLFIYDIYNTQIKEDVYTGSKSEPITSSK